MGKNVTKSSITPYYSTITTSCYAPSPHQKSDTTPYYTTIIPPCYATTSPHKKPVTTPYYTTTTSPHHAPSQYSQLEHYSAPTTAPIKRSTSDNCLAFYEKIYPHQKDENNRDNLKSTTQVELHDM